MTDQLHRRPSARPETPPYPPMHPTSSPDQDHHEAHTAPQGDGGHGGHRLMMIACCIPMLVIVGILVLTGVAGPGLIVYAVVCTVMMAVMMFAMPGGHRH